MAKHNTTSTISTDAFIRHAIELVLAARQLVVRQTNSVMVFTYFQIGRHIIKYEQAGNKRAAFGKNILPQLSISLVKEFVRGFFIDNLENMRRFYLTFSISETLSRKSRDPGR